MTKRSMFCVLAVGLLLPSTGCQCMSNFLCSQPACGGSAGGYVADDCGGCGNCDSCLGGGCDTGCNSYGRPCFPLIRNVFQYVHRVHDCMCSSGCGTMGCGPRYTDAWSSSSCGGCGNCGGSHSSAYQAPYDVTPYMEPQPSQEPTIAPQPPASRTSYRPGRHQGRIAVGI